MPFLVICGFWFGHVLRLTFAAKFHLRQWDSSRAVASSLRALAGFASLILLWSGRASVLLMTALPLAMVLGWRIADEFYARQARTDPRFLRPED
jgi:hypothetical protein